MIFARWILFLRRKKKVASETHPPRIDSARLQTPYIVSQRSSDRARIISLACPKTRQTSVGRKLLSKESLRRGIFCRIYITRAAFEVYLPRVPHQRMRLTLASSACASIASFIDKKRNIHVFYSIAIISWILLDSTSTLRNINCRRIIFDSIFSLCILRMINK